MPGIGKGKFLFPVRIKHDNAAGMVKVTMGQNDIIYVLPCQPNFFKLLRQVPVFDDPVNLFLFLGEFVAKAGFNKYQGVRGFNQKRIIEELDIIFFETEGVLLVNRIFFCPECFWDNPEHGAAVKLEFTTIEPENFKIAKFVTFHV